MPRLVLPAQSITLRGGGLANGAAETSCAPLDLEALLRRAATSAVAAADVQGTDRVVLSEDTLEALACIAAEVLGDSGDGADATKLEALRAALLESLTPVFQEAALCELAQSRIIASLLTASGADVAAEVIVPGPKLSSRPLPPSRPPPVDGEIGPKYRRRGEVEQERAEEYLQEHEKQIEFEREEDDARERQLADYYGVTLFPEASKIGAPGCFNPAAAAGVTNADDDSSTDSEADEDDEVTRKDREATKNRLRQLCQPATFFGEDDEARTARLNELELNREQDDIAGGSVNVLQMVNRRGAHGVNVDNDDEDFHVAGKRKSSPVPLPALMDDGEQAPALPTDDDDDDAELDAADQDIKTVSLWLRATLREWEAELTAQQTAEKDHLSRQFADDRAQYRQSKQYLRPLRKALRDGSINPMIVSSCARIAEWCDKKMYKEAKECYMKLAIGNMAWPMGVTQITFHDRPNRHMIGEDNIAHILNDETTRKYVQMVKRLVSYAERRWPIDPSRAA